MKRPSAPCCFSRGISSVITLTRPPIAVALPILQNQHAVAVEAADHRSCRRRAEAARRHARLILERLSERHLELLVELLAGQDRGWLIRLKCAAGVGTD